jgi:hypothetical protein
MGCMKLFKKSYHLLLLALLHHTVQAQEATVTDSYDMKDTSDHFRMMTSLEFKNKNW